MVTTTYLQIYRNKWQFISNTVELAIWINNTSLKMTSHVYLFYISDENSSDIEEMAAVGLTAAERNKLG
jgi:hypothetical protein